ncbi:MAG: FAD:protein FMN transferase [Kineosporiaceae bacterium]
MSGPLAPVPRPRADAGRDPADLPFLDGAVPLREVPRRAWVETLMGIPVSVHVRGPGAREGSDAVGAGSASRAAVRGAVAAVYAELQRVERVLSPWRPGSDLCRWDRGELALAEAHPDLATVLELCDTAKELTGGWFDVEHAAGGPVEAGRQALAKDPTGLVKGWAVQRASRHLAALSGHDFMINAGGDIVVGCDRIDTPDWHLAIEDPAARDRTLMSVRLRTGALATSGTAARGDHLVDPHTLKPVRPFASVSVIGPDLTWVDVWATAAFTAAGAAAGLLSAQVDLVGVLVHLDGAVEVVRPPSPSEA